MVALEGLFVDITEAMSRLECHPKQWEIQTTKSISPTNIIFTRAIHRGLTRIIHSLEPADLSE